jgi:hypothetical protein
MSNSAYDIFLDHCVDEHYEDNEEDWEIPWPDEDPEIDNAPDYDNYDGWDDMQ